MIIRIGARYLLSRLMILHGEHGSSMFMRGNACGVSMCVRQLYLQLFGLKLFWNDENFCAKLINFAIILLTT